MNLALDLLAMDLTNDPDPVRYDGTPPKLEKESVLLTSLFDITGYLIRTAFADTGADDAVYYYINDHLGTPQIIIDETGNIVWKGDYQPFGSVDAVVSDLGNNFRFAGQYYDEETGLHYNYHRYYDPNTGRYLTPDPIGLAGMDPNLYGYVLNNPVNFVDPLGLEIRVYSSDAFGLRGLNHAFVYSTELERQKGRAGKSGGNWGSGGGDLRSPYVVVELKGLTESEFMNRIERYPGWNTGAWLPLLDDCHSELAEAFEYAGVPYPGAPNERIDIDDVFVDMSRRIWEKTFDWFNRFFDWDNSEPCK